MSRPLSRILSLSLPLRDSPSPDHQIFDSSEVDTLMAPKGGNAKKETGRTKKAENEANKRAATEEAKVRLPFYADILFPT